MYSQEMLDNKRFLTARKSTQNHESRNVIFKIK